ncbi:MAG: O-acetyl-ADP-ribose deacetylase [Flexibacteraceae bacterium]
MIKVVLGDITKVAVDCIVNAANKSLLGGGGVDGAIHRAGGPAILEECKIISDRQGGCKVGEAVITTAGNLPAKFVIHTVGPIWNGGKKKEEQLLSNAYLNSLMLASENGISSISFPNISTGVYRFPKDLAANIAVQTARDFLKNNELNSLREIIFVCFDNENFELYQHLLAE